MKRIRAYVTNPQFLEDKFLDYNAEISKNLNSTVEFVIHGKEIFEPTISPILGSGLPKLGTLESDELRKSFEKYTEAQDGLSFTISQDIFAEIFSNVDAREDLILHTFSGRDADFVLHNIYSENALDAAFDNISPSLFIPLNYAYVQPRIIYILLFSKDLGSDLRPLVAMCKSLHAKVKFIIQEPTDDKVDESILEKIAQLNNLDFSTFNFSARFVEKIDSSTINQLQDTEPAYWTVFQHSFLLKDFNDKSLSIDMYQLLAESNQPTLIV